MIFNRRIYMLEIKQIFEKEKYIVYNKDTRM